MSTPMKQTLLSDLDTIERRFRRMFDAGPLAPFVFATVPAADVYETATDFVVELEVPGYSEEELTLELSDHMLRVTGKREATTEETDKTYRLQERLERTFARSFQLPSEADTAHVTARFDQGVLKVLAPRLAETMPQKVPISKA